jgi:hypothetical protein
MKNRQKMPVGAPLAQTTQTKLHKTSRKAAGPDAVSTVYREYQTLVRNEFNFKVPDPAAKDIGMMKHLTKRWGDQTVSVLETIIRSYTDFRVYFEEMEGEPLKGAYPSLAMLLKYHHLGPNFAEHLESNGEQKPESEGTGEMTFEVQEPEQQKVKITVVN